MKRIMRIAILLAVAACFLSACSLPYTKPDSGSFYCDELEMTLDFSTHQATFMEEGVETTKRFSIRYGPRLSITDFDEEGVYQPVLSGDFKYQFGKVTIKTNEGKKYTFLPMEEQCHT